MHPKRWPDTAFAPARDDGGPDRLAMPSDLWTLPCAAGRGRTATGRLGDWIFGCRLTDGRAIVMRCSRASGDQAFGGGGVRKVRIPCSHDHHGRGRDVGQSGFGRVVIRPGGEGERLGVPGSAQAGHDRAPVLVEVLGALAGVELR